MNDKNLINKINQHAHPIKTIADLDPLLEQIGDASIVLLGEATHGTKEFYTLRTQITKRLIQEKGFRAICVEGDFPACYNINRYIQHFNGIDSVEKALEDFKRFPTWMWANVEIVKLITWLREWNKEKEFINRTGFYGLDLYSLYESIEAVIDYLTTIDPKAAQKAFDRYGCFDFAHPDAQKYGHLSAMDDRYGCRDIVVEQLKELQTKAYQYTKDKGVLAQEKQFYAEQNAHIIVDAEHYYRSLFFATSPYSWNIRDNHMFDTLQQIIHYYQTIGKNQKMIVWAHNSHLGNAQATYMSSRGKINIGQLVKETYGNDAISIGFTTYDGHVTAASNWGESPQCKKVNPALAESYEWLFHQVGIPNFYLNLSHAKSSMPELNNTRLERAIGVLYLPSTERQNHYFTAQLLDQFDALIHIDTSHALEPIKKVEGWADPEVPETYPFGV